LRESQELSNKIKVVFVELMTLNLSVAVVVILKDTPILAVLFVPLFGKCCKIRLKRSQSIQKMPKEWKKSRR